jgi:hypothetical protein
MERRGNRRGDRGLFIGVAGASNQSGSKGIEEGREELLETVTGEINGRRLKTTGSPDKWGPVVSGWEHTPSGFLPSRAVGLF